MIKDEAHNILVSALTYFIHTQMAGRPCEDDADGKAIWEAALASGLARFSQDHDALPEVNEAYRTLFGSAN